MFLDDALLTVGETTEISTAVSLVMMHASLEQLELATVKIVS